MTFQSRSNHTWIRPSLAPRQMSAAWLACLESKLHNFCAASEQKHDGSRDVQWLSETKNPIEFAAGREMMRNRMS